MSAYYNEWEPYPAQWLRNLIKADLIAPGDVDERSIKNVKADDLKNYTQCHFFAGIGGWSHALRLAGWPDERPVWTGSCPCQPFSAAGKKTAQSDERHLWPDWYRLISELEPSTIFGEQVANAIALGWLDDVALNLETKDYAFASAVLPACSVGAPHKRDRLFFVADSQCAGLSSRAIECTHSSTKQSFESSRGRFGYSIGEAWKCEPELALLVDGIPADVATVSAYGNAIVPQVAQAFIAAFMECRP